MRTDELRNVVQAISGERAPRNLRDEVQTQIGPFRILEQIGLGGMGIVYLAEQSKPLHRRVALKIIKLGMNTREVVARFEAEREALALMNHPHVAKVFDAGAMNDGRPYFVMEYVAGISITSYCDRNTLSTDERLRLFVDVCRAVRHAHQKGIIHRDIKPSNVLVTVQDGKPVPKVIDFGVAKATQRRLTEDTVYTELGQLIGTPGYMSPEQAEMTALDVDQRTDVYSLGVLLYELLVGALPFDTDSWRHMGIAEMQRIIREVEPPRPSTRFSGLGKSSTAIAQKRRTEAKTLSRQLRGDLDWIVMKCLEKDRTRRYDSAEALASDLESYLERRPIIARPPSLGYRLTKFTHRHRKALGAFGVCVTLGAAAAFSFLQWRASALAVEQEKASSLFHQGMLDAMSRPDAAIVKFDQAASLLPGYIEPRLQKAILLKRENRYEDALNTAMSLVNEQPDCGPAHLLLAQLHSDRDVAKAAFHRTEGQRLLPNDRYYTALSFGPDQNAEAIALLTSFLEEEGTHFDARWARAWRYFNVRNYEAMLDDADFLIKARSKYASAWNLKATALSRLRRENEALQAYTRAIELAPDYAPTYSNRADLLVRMKRRQEALIDCDRALALEPDLAVVRAERAWVYVLLGRLDKAEADCQHILAKSPDDPFAWQRIGNIRWLRKDLTGAEEAFGRAIAGRRELVGAWTDRAAVRYELGQFEDALADIMTAVELDPQDEIPLNRRALIRYRIGEITAAEADLDRAITLNPTYGEALHNRARLRRAQARLTEALVDHDRALALGTTGDRLAARAITKRAMGSVEGALRDLKLVVEKYPKESALIRLWIWEILMLSDTPAAKQEAAHQLREAATATATTWEETIIRFFDGEFTAEELVSAATGLQQQLEAMYAAGSLALVYGHLSQARHWFAACVTTNAVDLPEYDVAKWHLQRLSGE